MTLSNIIFTVISGIVIAGFLLGAAFELWKKLWITTVGEVLAVRQTARYVPNEGRKIVVLIRYRYVSQSREYIHEETKPLDVNYYEEKDAMDSINSQFPLGGKIAVYHPLSLPDVSSITPGGAAMPKLLTSFILIACYLLMQYILFTNMFTR